MKALDFVIDDFDLKVCDVQGRLFEISVRDGANSSEFIKQFMRSDVAYHLDGVYDHMQWAGEEYLYAEIKDIAGDKLYKTGEIFDIDMMYWIGYLYRYWHYFTGESSKEIFKQAPIKVMCSSYLMFHTMDPRLAIEKLKEIHSQK